MIRKSIKTEMIVFLLGLVSVSIIITGYVGVISLINAGKDAQQKTAASFTGQAEKFLVQLTISSAEKNDIVLKRINNCAGNMAEYIKNVFDNPDNFAKKNYWRFDDHVLKGDKGQYMNGLNDTSSVFIPNYVNVKDKQVRDELELNAYLDYVFPQWYKNDNNTVAEWMVGIKETTRYYPNIGLGSIVPPDIKPTEEIFFAVADPKNNPERKVVWTPVYDDPAAQGLMITASAPIYTKKGFSGVLGVDVTLNSIIKNIEEYKPIEQSYSFLIDKDGYSIALPEQAYIDIFGRNREANESRVNLNNLTNKFSLVINKMKEGSTGFEIINLGNKKMHVAYAPLKETGFSLGMVIEEQVLLEVVKLIQEEINDSTQELIYLRILPVGLLIISAAWIFGFLLITRITRPIKMLTETAKEISKGNLDAKIEVMSENEIGKLALAFRQMTGELKKSKVKLEEHGMSLEKQVEGRIKELKTKNEDLEKFNRMAVDREIKMIELKKEIKELKEKLGEA